MCATLAAAFGSALATAATLERVEFEQTEQHYVASMWIRLDVPAAEAFAVMTDFDALPRLNPSIIEAEMVADNRLRTVVSMCVLFFCKRVQQVQVVTMPGELRLTMRILPEQSDLKFGTASWHFVPLGPKQSRIVFRAEIAPDFWVPPLIGPWLIENKITEETLITSEGIETLVREREH